MGAAWITLTFSSKPTISNSTPYWPAVFYGNSGGQSNILHHDTGASGSGKSQDTANTYPTFPTTASFTNETRIYSIHANYTEGTTTPSVTTNAATSVSTSTATLNGTIVSDGGAAITQHGFAWGTNSTLSGGDTATTTLGTNIEGNFSENFTSLPLSTTYYFRAYITNSIGTFTGSILSFKTNNNYQSTFNGGFNIKGSATIK